MGVRQTGHVLSVLGRNSDYIIEPIRFALGFTRCQMVDDHLSGLARRAVDHPDIDELLDARRAWSGS